MDPIAAIARWVVELEDEKSHVHDYPVVAWDLEGTSKEWLIIYATDQGLRVVCNDEYPVLKFMGQTLQLAPDQRTAK